MRRVLNGSLDPKEVAQAVQVVSDRGGFVTVDRTIRPSYPNWTEEVLYFALQTTGPAQFNVNTLVQWLHNDQKTSTGKGNVIYEYLKTNNMLEGCLGLRDLEEIQKKGIKFFRRHFQDKAVFGWKSVVRASSGNLLAPYLLEGGDLVVLQWRWLENDWSSSYPALRFA
jgi:hypothetical protein